MSSRREEVAAQNQGKKVPPVGKSKPNVHDVRGRRFKIALAIALLIIIGGVIAWAVVSGPSLTGYFADMGKGERVFRPSGNELASSKCMEKEPIQWTADRSTPIRRGAIFVSIPAYRDDECKDTINEMYKRAKYPDRIYCGVVQQIKYQEENCFDKCPDCARRKASGHIRFIEYDFSEARGPCQARFQASTLWKGEEWYMQIDSHTRFEDDWDQTMLDQLRLTKDPKAVMGGYPPTEHQMDQIKSGGFTQTTMMCDGGKFNSDGIPMLKASIVSVKNRQKPVLIPFIGANMMTMPYTALFDAPFDPYLSFLFFGEEILHSARLWTNGYNFYSPAKPYASHHYTRDGKPKFWSDNRAYEGCRRKAVERCKYLLGFEKTDRKVHKDFKRDIHMYGMGSVRSLDDYWKFADIDPGAQRTGRHCDPNGYENR